MNPYRNAIRTLIFVLAFAMGICCYGQDNTVSNTQTVAPQESQKPQEPPHKIMTGTVNEVRAVFRILRITGEQGLVTVQVPDKTPITKGIKSIGLDDINTGDSVVVTYYSPEPGEYIAVSILDSTMDSG